MLRNKFQKEMDALGLELIEMGKLVVDAIDVSLKALVNQDRELCNQVIERENEIDAARYEIESHALKILLMQQPVASDLRAISTALKMIVDMERIGDQAGDICEIVLYLCEEEYQPKLVILPQMGECVAKMVSDSIESFINQDVELAKKVIEADDEIDELFNKLKQKMIRLLREKPKYADQFVYFLMVGKYFEKIGDHAENIAQWVIFAKTGEHRKQNI